MAPCEQIQCPFNYSFPPSNLQWGEKNLSVMSLVKRLILSVVTFPKELMLFVIDAEHSIGCDSQRLGEVSTSLISREKFGHDFPRVHRSACALDPRIRGGGFPPTSPFKLPTLQISIRILEALKCFLEKPTSLQSSPLAADQADI